jgi:hypothetical protein
MHRWLHPEILSCNFWLRGGGRHRTAASPSRAMTGGQQVLLSNKAVALPVLWPGHEVVPLNKGILFPSPAMFSPPYTPHDGTRTKIVIFT